MPREADLEQQQEPRGESENAAVIRRMYELYNRLPSDPEERRSSEAWRQLGECFDRGVALIQPDGSGGAGLDSTRGLDSVTAQWDDWLSGWESHHSEVVELRESGDRVLVFTDDRFIGRAGIEIEIEGAIIFEVRNGRIAHFEVFPNRRAQAQAAFDPGATAK